MSQKIDSALVLSNANSTVLL